MMFAIGRHLEKFVNFIFSLEKQVSFMKIWIKTKYNQIVTQISNIP